MLVCRTLEIVMFVCERGWLINASWLSFQEEGPNIKTNPLSSHGGASVNTIEKDRPSGSKRLEDVATSRRFIYQSLQAACMVSRGGGEIEEYF